MLLHCREHQHLSVLSFKLRGSPSKEAKEAGKEREVRENVGAGRDYSEIMHSG